MTDIIDMANERAELDLAISIKAHQRHEPALPYVGQCYNCLTELPEGRRFCDKNCADDYDHRKRLEARR